MKKQFILGITALALLAGSGATLASCQPTHENLNVSISLNRTSANLEIGSTITLRSSVNPGDSGATDLTSSFTVDNPDVVQLGETTTNTTSVEITGLKAGTATITAASTVNPSITATCTITVIEALPTLPNLFETLETAHNYTVVTNYSGSALTGDFSESLYLTEDSLIRTTTGSDGKPSALWYALDENGDPITKVVEPSDPTQAPTTLHGQNWGLVVRGQDVVYLQYDPDGKIISDAYKVKSGAGFLTPENFDGSDLSNPINGNTYFKSLAVIDPTLLPAEKASDNTYVIDGSNIETNPNGYLAEIGLVETLAFSLESLVAQIIQSNQYADILAAIDTTITVTDQNNMTVKFVYDDDGNDITAEATISNVGTTALSSTIGLPETYASDIETIKPYTPALPSNLTAFLDAINSNNYCKIGAYVTNASDGTQVPFTKYTYYTENYVIYGMYDIKGITSLLGAGVVSSIDEIGTEVFYFVPTGEQNGTTIGAVYLDYLTYAIQNNGDGTTSLTYAMLGKPQEVALYKDNQGNPVFEINQEMFYKGMGYMSTSGLFDADRVQAFVTPGFTGMEDAYGTRNTDLCKEYFDYFGVLSQINEEFPTIYDYWFIIDPVFNKGEISTATLQMLFDPTGAGSYYGYSFDYDFGGVDKELNQIIVDNFTQSEAGTNS